jgi:predicted nucleic acid-binding protein
VRYLLDTTLIVDHAHGFEPATQLLRRLYDEGAELFTCDVVVSEALSGGSDEHIDVVSRLLAPLDFVATDPIAARRAPHATQGGRQAWRGRRADRRGRGSPGRHHCDPESCGF